ncbi:MAG: glycosyltransferase family 2 protein [Marinilabiliaceae bacterium]|nr:glycosyltransferase family 2 protein [Marinilabiliaceae bacterium]
MISLVIPVYNEVELLGALIPRVINVFESLGSDYEVIFVDDGSTDGSLQNLVEFRATNHHIKVITLSRNFGHQSALTAGLEYANGEYVALMDCDLQDPPELLVEMYDKLKTGDYDVITGYRKERNERAGRKILTKLFHRIFSRTSGLTEIEHTGHFSMMTRQALQALLSMKEKTRYLPGLRSFLGFRQGQVEYVRQERAAGDSKMKIGHLFKLAGDALFAFSKFPLRFCLYLGLFGIVLFLLAGIYVLVSKMLGWAPIGWSSTMISIYFLGSIQLLFMGVLGEYIFRIYKESQNRPLYFIKKIYDSVNE